MLVLTANLNNIAVTIPDCTRQEAEEIKKAIHVLSATLHARPITCQIAATVGLP